MKHVRFLDLQQIFKTFFVKIMVMLLICLMIGIIPTMSRAQELSAQNVAQVEMSESDIEPMLVLDQVVLSSAMPDQGTPIFMRAREAVNALMKAYIFDDWMLFEEKIFSGFPERMVFLFETQTARMQKIPDDFQFFISTVNETKEVLSVSFSWIKKHMNWDNPNDTKAEGKCEFVFQKTSQGLLLKNVIGNYPF